MEEIEIELDMHRQSIEMCDAIISLCKGVDCDPDIKSMRQKFEARKYFAISMIIAIKKQRL